MQTDLHYSLLVAGAELPGLRRGAGHLLPYQSPSLVTTRTLDMSVDASKEWWDRFHAQIVNEWYCDVMTAADAVDRYCPGAVTVLHVGSGSSMLAQELGDRGAALVMDVEFADIPAEVNAAQGHAQREALSADARGLPLRATWADCVVDKGTLDTIMAKYPPSSIVSGAVSPAAGALRAWSRLLAPGGWLLVFSLFDNRTAVFEAAGLAVTHRELPISPLELPEQKVLHLYVARPHSPPAGRS